MTIVREHYDSKTGQWVDGPRRQRRVRADGPAVISDSLPDLINHADGKRYSSKRGFERAVRAAGYDIVGNDQAIMRERQDIETPGLERDIKSAMEQLCNRERR